MKAIIILLVLVGFAFSPTARRELVRTLSFVIPVLGGVLLLVWAIGSASRSGRRW